MKGSWNEAVWTEGGHLRTEADEAAEAGSAGGKHHYRITVASDWAPLRGHEAIMVERPLDIFGDLLPLFRESDLNIVNVEAVLGDHGQPILKDGPCLRGDERAVQGLVEAPFHVACLANNHTCDYGPEGLRHTIDVLHKAGLHTVGAGMNGEEAAKPLLLQAGAVKLAVVNFAEGEACRSVNGSPGAHGFDPHTAALRIHEAKQQAEIVLAVYHGGREYTPMPPVYVVEGLRKAAEAGASAVIAHHPHVPQGMEFHHGVPIVYSQGNFVFWQENDLYYRHVGYLVHLDFAGDRLVKLELSPYTIGREGLSLLAGKDKEYLLSQLQHISRLLTEPKAVKMAWDAFVDRVGVQGMVARLQSDLDMIAQDTPAGAARLYNMFFTSAHNELFLNGLKRAASGEAGASPEWAKELVERWMTEKING
ncbi:CapA family protein [Paenibacillus thalictri]|uniref:CapA family protein n=1 Tax=Paenibacillus thalictri TaxID=2527873 RepID=A0A4Q9DXG9_9BACL|nr:CapA family protein [Paenibacillus thalictri]TBL81809.1 CapA family protein [Paenibacillus thalictri]